jgi:hypothetical protein
MAYGPKVEFGSTADATFRDLREALRTVTGCIDLAHRNGPIGYSPVSSQSTLTLNFLFIRSRTSAAGNATPLSYFESWLWLIPNCRAKSSWVNSNPRVCLIRRPTAPTSATSEAEVLFLTFILI